MVAIQITLLHTITYSAIDTELGHTELMLPLSPVCCLLTGEISTKVTIIIIHLFNNISKCMFFHFVEKIL